jgi:CheY-like chemotaxis protein
VRELTGSRILLVDDDPPSLDFLCEVLGSQGCTVFVATSGELALLTTARSLPDLVLLDVRLPGIDGIETCRRLKASPDTAEIPVLLISADPTDRSLQDGLRAGAVDLLPKRPPWDDVLLRIRNQLGR